MTAYGASIQRIEREIRAIYVLLQSVLETQREMMTTLQDVQDAVRSESDAVTALIELVQRLAQMVRDNVGDPAALTALVDEIQAETAAIADATLANTPADPNAPAAVEPPAEPTA